MPEPSERLTVLIAGLKWPAETFLQRLIRGLLDEGVEVTVATSRRPDPSWLRQPGFDWLHVPDWEGPAPARLARLGGTFGRAAISNLGAVRRLVQDTGEAAAVERMRELNRLLPFAGRRWDVVYFPWNTGAIQYRRLFRQASAVVLGCRGAHVNVAPHNPERVSIVEGLRDTFREASAVHCVSQAILEEAVRYGLAPEKAHVIRPAVDPDVFCPGHERTGSEPGRLHLVTTGSLIWRKGLEYLLAAVRLVADAGVDVRLQIIGDGPERQRVLYTIHDLDLVDRVMLRGRLAPAEVVRTLQSADAFALASLSEGISNAVLEAMSCGLPVVTTDCGGMREAVTDGVEGFVVPTREPEAMAEALVRLAGDPDLRRRMGAAGRERILRDFRLEDQVTRFVALFRRVTPLPSSSELSDPLSTSSPLRT